MTDVEELLRDTLADPRRRLEPEAQQYEQLGARTAALRRQRVRRRLAGALAAVAVLALLVAGGIVTSGRSPAPVGRRNGPAAATGVQSEVAAANGGLYILAPDPPSLRRVDATLRVTASAGIPSSMTANTRLAVAPTGRWLWLIDQNRGHLVVREYDGRTLKLRYHETVPSRMVGGYVFTMVATGSRLWLGTQHGVYLVDPADRIGVGLTSVSTGRPVYALAADHDRLLAGMAADHGIRVESIDLSRLTVTARSSVLPLIKESIAVVDGRIWVGGYGAGSVSKLYRLNPRTLRPSASTLDRLGPGAVVWPGSAVLWVRDGGSEQLACLDPAGGTVLQQWSSVSGPVASIPGGALAVGDSGVRRLDLNAACTG